ncbi:hypothetical protein KHA80_17330 [Anaerobacillus sp. HL2]|nr:hypothetical protein KHA80_17330 [Anaerobacillus sp. HL2]
MNVEGFLTIDECLEEETSLAIFMRLFIDDEKIDKGLSTLSKLKQFYEGWVPYLPQVSDERIFVWLFQHSGLKSMLLLQRNNLQQVKNVAKLIDVLTEFQTASLDDLLRQVHQLSFIR